MLPRDEACYTNMLKLIGNCVKCDSEEEALNNTLKMTAGGLQDYKLIYDRALKKGYASDEVLEVFNQWGQRGFHWYLIGTDINGYLRSLLYDVVKDEITTFINNIDPKWYNRRIWSQFDKK